MEDIPQHFKSLLHKIAKEQKFVDYDLNIKPISSGGANYTSRLYLVTVTEGSNVLNLFAKIAAFGEKMRSQMPDFYTIENFFYTKLMNIYENLEEENQVPDEHKLSLPKFYGCNPSKFEETIVLENLEIEGYSTYNRFKSIDWAYARSAVTELAKMHSLSFAYGKYHPEQYEELVEKFKWEMDPSVIKAHFEGVVQRAISLTREENRDKLKRYFETFDPEAFFTFYTAQRRPAVGHGDFRPSNLMHKNLDDGTLVMKVLDLQTLKSGSPVTDLLYFILTGSDEQFRDQYYDKLIDHYYTQLCDAMKRLHLNPDEIYSREDFDYELKEKTPYGLSLAVIILPVVTVDTENAPTVDEDLDMTALSVDKPSDLYTDRLNGIINDYVKWGILQ